MGQAETVLGKNAGLSRVVTDAVRRLCGVMS
jgi:hypothetical protein